MDFSVPPIDSSDVYNANADFCQTSQAKILELPEKCIANILKFVPLQQIDDIIELFPKWDKIVQDHVPVEVHLTDIGFRIAHHYFMGHEDLPKYKIKIVHSRVLDETIPELKSPEDLEMIEFATHTEPSTFKSLLFKAVNLKELQFGYGSLSSMTFSSEFELPNLRVLTICDRPIDFKGNEETRKILPNNFMSFLKKRFPKIQTLSVVTAASRELTTSYVQCLLKFIHTHRDTLKNVKFHVSTLLQSLIEETNFTTAGFADIQFTDEELNMAELMSVKLKQLDLSFGENFFVALDQWGAVLNNQEEMNDLRVGLDKPLHPSFFSTLISKSAQNLITLRVGVEVFNKATGGRNPFDCTILENCDALRNLTLIGPPHPEGSDKRPTSPEILSLSKLPKRLTSLEIKNIFVETKEIAGVVNKLTPLQGLQIEHAGWSGECGVTPSLLDFWIKNKQVKEILVNGMNDEKGGLETFPHLAEFGLGNPLAKCKFHALYYTNLKEYRKPNDKIERAFEFT